MRIASMLGRAALVLIGVSLLGFLAYDASAVTRLMGLDPQGNEAGVVLAGLAVAAASLGLGLWARRDPRHAGRSATQR